MADDLKPGDKSDVASAVRDSLIGLVARAEAAVSLSAEAFAHLAAVAGMYEIEAARIALSRSKNADVQDIARRMIEDHTKIASELKSWMGAMNTPHEPPKTLDKPFEVLIDDLKGASESDFDHRYLAQQEATHRAAITLFKSYHAHGDDSGLKNLTALALPVLEKHLAMVESVRAAR